MIRNYISAFFLGTYLFLATGCKEDSINVPQIEVEPSDEALDKYIDQNFTEPFGIAVRYTYVDRYVETGKRVVPPKADLVKPMLDFLSDYWITPYTSVANGKDFFTRYVPAEMVFIGSPIYNGDGTITLGTADAGARITLTQVNEIDTENREWVFLQLHVINHEFAHIMHQRYNLPPSWQEISPEGYTSSGSWYNLTDEEALQRGFVSPYGTSSFNEDFAEVVSFIIYDPDFTTKYLADETGCTTTACEARNEGRAKLRRKYNAILAHYKQYALIDLLKVRELVQNKLD